MQYLNEERVRSLAYQIWESEGRPSGHEYRHWEMASMLANEQQSGEFDEMAMAVDAKNNIPAETYNIDPSNQHAAPVINAEAEPSQAKASRKKSAKKISS